MRPYKRIAVRDRHYLLKLVHYIHYNPIEAKLCRDSASWPHSSYNDIVNNGASFLRKFEGIEWFEDLENFVYIHQNSPDETAINNFS